MPTIPKGDFEKEYQKREQTYISLETEAKHTLESELEKTVKIHSITSRVKNLESFFKKADSKDSKDPFSEIFDAVGVRVICLFLTDLEKVEKKIHEIFDVLKADEKVKLADPTSFGYLSNHYIARIPKSFRGPRYEGLHQLVFEIQVRTVAMDAWATISHYLSYKSEIDIPEELKKDFHAISGLFYVADSHFELFYKQQIESRRLTKDAIEKHDLEALSLNLDTLAAFLDKKFPDRNPPHDSGLNDLLAELVGAGYKSIDELEVGLQQTNKAFLKYEKENPPSRGGANFDGRYNRAGVARASFNILDPKFRKFQKNAENRDFKEYIKYASLIEKVGTQNSG